jgi:GT2 family glycosyltransferase
MHVEVGLKALAAGSPHVARERHLPQEGQDAREGQPCPVQTSIIIVTFNHRREIDACLRSMEMHFADAEIIVVDNLSTDGTLDHVRQRYPRVRAVSSGRNDGFGAGVNLGVHMACGTFLAIINPDIEVLPGWLESLIAVLEEQPQVGLVTPTILLAANADNANACGNSPHLTGLTFCIGLHQPAPAPSDAPHPVSAISGAAFVLRRSLWDRLGGFDEQFFMYLEDTDISWRVLRSGYTIAHVPASRVWHDYELTMSATKMYYLEYNRLLLLRRNMASATLAILSPALLATEALIWAFCLRKGQAYLRAKWRSYCQLWSDRHKIDRPAASSPHPDRRLLRTLAARLTVEQLETSTGASLANGVLTAFYALWRIVALAIVRW